MTVAEFSEMHMLQMEEDLAEFRESLEKIFKTGRPRKTKANKPTDIQDIFQESIEEMNEGGSRKQEMDMMGAEDKRSRVADKKETARLKKEKLAAERAVKAAKKEQEKQERAAKKEQEKQEKAAKRVADAEAKKMAKLAKISENLEKPKRSRAKPKAPEVESEPKPDVVERDGVVYIVFSDSEYILRDTQCFCEDRLVGKWDGESIDMYGLGVEMVEMDFKDVVLGEETITATYPIDKFCNVYDGEIIGVYKPQLHTIVRNKLSKEEMEELFGDLSDLEDETEETEVKAVPEVKAAPDVVEEAPEVVEEVEVVPEVVEKVVEEVPKVVEEVEEVAVEKTKGKKESKPKEERPKKESKKETKAKEEKPKKDKKETKEKTKGKKEEPKEEVQKKRFTKTGDNVFDAETKMNYILRNNFCFLEKDVGFKLAGSWDTEIKFMVADDNEDEVSAIAIRLTEVTVKRGDEECIKTEKYTMDFECNIFNANGDSIGEYNPKEHVVYLDEEEDAEEEEEEYDE